MIKKTRCLNRWELELYRTLKSWMLWQRSRSGKAGAIGRGLNICGFVGCICHGFVAIRREVERFWKISREWVNSMGDKWWLWQHGRMDWGVEERKEGVSQENLPVGEVRWNKFWLEWQLWVLETWLWPRMF